MNSAHREKTVGKLETLKCARRNCVTIWRDIRERCSAVNEVVYGNCYIQLNMVSTNPSVGTATLSRMRNTFCGIPKAEIERRNVALLQAMTVSSVSGYPERVFPIIHYDYADEGYTE